MSYYPVLNLPRRRSLGDGTCGDLMSFAAAKPLLATALADWAPVKSWKIALDANQQPLLNVFVQADASEFADLYTYALANEAGINAINAKVSAQIAQPAFCLLGGEGAVLTEWGTKVARLKALMAKVTNQGSGGGTSGGTGGSGTGTGTGTGGKIVVIWPGGAGQQQQSQQPQGQQAVPADAQAAATAKTKAEEDAKKKELTKNVLIGGGILAAIGTGIWALVRK